MEYLSKNCKLIAKSNNFSDYCCFLLNLLNEGGKMTELVSIIIPCFNVEKQLIGV